MARKILTEADIRKRKRGMVIGVASGCVGILVLAGIIALVVYLRLTGKPAPPPEAQIATQSQQSQQPVASVDQQVSAIQKQARPGTVQPVQLVVTSQDLTSSIARNLRGNDIQNLQVHLGNGTAAAQGRVNLDGRNLWVTLRFRPRAENGKVRLDIQEARLGNVTMPEALRQKIQQEIDKQSLTSDVGADGMWIDSVNISQGRLYLQGRVQGR